MKKRIISFILAFVMVVALVPVVKADALTPMPTHNLAVLNAEKNKLVVYCMDWNCRLTASATLTIPEKEVLFTGKAITPAKVEYQGEWKKLVGKDLTVTYENNTWPGTATVKASVAIGGKTYTISDTFTIGFKKYSPLSVVNATNAKNNYGNANIDEKADLTKLFTQQELYSAKSASVYFMLDAPNQDLQFYSILEKNFPLPSSLVYGLFLESQLWKSVNNATPVRINNTTDEILVKFTLPKELREAGKEFRIVRFLDNGKYDYVVPSYDEKTGVIGFKTNIFGNFAVAFSGYKGLDPDVEGTQYTIKAEAANAAVLVVEKSVADAVIPFAVKVNDGYEVDKIVVTAAGSTTPLTVNNLGNGVFGFKMPKANVKITVTTKAKAPAVPKLPFEDILPTDVNYNAVGFVYANGLMVGLSDTIFGGSYPITRGMIVAILWRLEGCPIVLKDLAFYDVNIKEYYGPAVIWAEANGIVNGFGDGTFRPNQNISREQLASILYRYARYKGQGFTGDWSFLLPYEDRASVSSWADESVKWCVMNQIILGRTNTQYVPAAEATRMETAVALTALCKVLEGK